MALFYKDIHMTNLLLNDTFASYQENIESADIQCSLGIDITSKDKTKIFLKANTPITDKISNKIKQLKETGVIAAYAPDDAIKITNPTKKEVLISSIIDTVKADPVLTHFQLAETLATITDYVRTETIPTKIVEHLTVFSQFNPKEFEHTLFNLVFGTHIGKAKNYSPSQLHDLMCVLFYEDIGFARLDPAMKNSYKVHPIISKEIVEYAGITNPLILEAILQHEEKLDGTGYPNNITEINEYAQISQIANQYSLLFKAEGNSASTLGEIILLGQQFDFRTSCYKPSVYHSLLQKPLIKISLEKLESPQQLDQYAQHLHQELSNIIKWSNTNKNSNEEVRLIQQKIKNTLWVSKDSIEPFNISAGELSDSQLCRDFINDATRFIYSIVEAANYLDSKLHNPIEKNGSPLSRDSFLQMVNP